MMPWIKAIKSTSNIRGNGVIYFETDYVGDDVDLEHPRVLWSNIARRGTIAVSTEATGFDGVNAATETQHDAWKPTALPATWTLTFDASEAVNSVAIETHTLGTASATVTVQKWTGSAWADVVEASPSDDEPLAFLFGEITTDRIRIEITGSTIPQMAVIMCSRSIEFPQRVYMGGPVPIDMALSTEFETNQSATGKYMGRSIMRQKSTNDFTVSHLTEYWVRNTLLPFIKDAREYPYFLLERPYSRPTGISYRWRDGDIRPERMGIQNLMSVSL